MGICRLRGECRRTSQQHQDSHGHASLVWRREDASRAMLVPSGFPPKRRSGQLLRGAGEAFAPPPPQLRTRPAGSEADADCAPHRQAGVAVALLRADFAADLEDRTAADRADVCVPTAFGFIRGKRKRRTALESRRGRTDRAADAQGCLQTAGCRPAHRNAKRRTRRTLPTRSLVLWRWSEVVNPSDLRPGRRQCDAPSSRKWTTGS